MQSSGETVYSEDGLGSPITPEHEQNLNTPYEAQEYRRELTGESLDSLLAKNKRDRATQKHVVDILAGARDHLEDIGRREQLQRQRRSPKIGGSFTHAPAANDHGAQQEV